jgi:hypothetical protein
VAAETPAIAAISFIFIMNLLSYETILVNYFLYHILAQITNMSSFSEKSQDLFFFSLKSYFNDVLLQLQSFCIIIETT